MNGSPDDSSAVVVKLMTITREEFQASLAALAAGAALGSDDRAVVGDAIVMFEALPKRRIGGLVSLPQARVTLDMSALTVVQRVAFLRHFGISFQRGGG